MIYTEFFELPDFNRAEILRYAGGGKENASVLTLLDECIDECRDIFKGRVCYKIADISTDCHMVDLSFTKTSSKALAKNLDGCTNAVIFAATVGIEIDRLIHRYSRLDLTKAVLMQAIGAERIEALCDMFCKKIEAAEGQKGLYTRPRFSPGYGDLSIEIQRDIIQNLDCHRKIGVTLNESLLMSPSKSVTAIIGLGAKKSCADTDGCISCDKKDCNFRKDNQ